MSKTTPSNANSNNLISETDLANLKAFDANQMKGFQAYSMWQNIDVFPFSFFYENFTNTKYADFPFKIGSFVLEFREKFENVKSVFILSHKVD